MNTPLTERQEQVLAFILEHQAENGRPPTTREIQRRFEFKSQNAVMNHLKALAAKGMVTQTGDGRTWAATTPMAQGLLFTVPMHGTIPAGRPSDNPSIHGESIRIDPATFGLDSARGLFALQVRGDSMINAQIADGDIALIKNRPARSGDIVAALIDGETTLKRLIQKKRQTLLRAENPRYRDLIPDESLVIQGVLVGVIGRGRR